MGRYLCDHLGFGRAEANQFFKQHAADGGIKFERFREGYATLNPYMISGREQEVIVRKPDSLRGEGITLERLEDCEIYICDRTAQVFLDFCKRCLVLIGPCESSVFVRDCEDCTIWLASQQLRTNNCNRCTFFMHARTEPIIETSDDLAFAPWAASYPKCSAHFQQAGFDPQKNLWNSIFDFSGKVDRSHWRILPLKEVLELSVELDEPPSETSPANNPVPRVTHDMLCAEPAPSGQSCGQGLNIPQTRPPLPVSPGPSESLRSFPARDADPGELCGARRLSAGGGGTDSKFSAGVLAETTSKVDRLIEPIASSLPPVARAVLAPKLPSPAPAHEASLVDEWGEDGL